MLPLLEFAIAEGVNLGYSTYMAGRAKTQAEARRKELLDWIHNGAFPEIDPGIYYQAQQIYEEARLKNLETTKARTEREMAAKGYLPTGYREAALREEERLAARDIAQQKKQSTLAMTTAQQARKQAIADAITKIKQGDYSGAQQLAGMWEGMVQRAPIDIANQVANIALSKWFYQTPETTALTPGKWEEMTPSEVKAYVKGIEGLEPAPGRIPLSTTPSPEETIDLGTVGTPKMTEATKIAGYLGQKMSPISNYTMYPSTPEVAGVETDTAKYLRSLLENQKEGLRYKPEGFVIKRF